MKRLIKKSDHDWHNRDLAFIYINGKYYEGITHAIAFEQFLDENDIESKGNSMLYRPNFNGMQVLSRDEGLVMIFGHLTEKENAVFLIYGIDNGTALEFKDINDSLKNEISQHYGLPIEDEANHDDDAENLYDEDEKGEQLDTEVATKEYEKMRNILSKSFTENGNVFTNNDITIILDTEDPKEIIAMIFRVGEPTVRANYRKFMDFRDQYLYNGDYFEFLQNFNAQYNFNPDMRAFDISLIISGDVLNFTYYCSGNKANKLTLVTKQDSKEKVRALGFNESAVTNENLESLLAENYKQASRLKKRFR